MAEDKARITEVVHGDDLQYKMYVAETLGELKSDMKTLIGNGQPGKIQLLEDRISKQDAKLSKHDWWFGIILGGSMVASWAFKGILSLFGIRF